MTGTGSDTLCSCSFHDVGSFGDGAGSIHHIVDDDHILTLDITDDLHAFDDVGTSASLVTQNQRTAQVFGIGVGTLGTAYVG